ncbi:MAG: HAMP domain-containing sensor histidine kinase [Bacteroidia bacterium]
MKIRTKLTYQFTIIVALIIIVFSVTIYNFFSEHRENEFYSRLREIANTTANLYSKEVKEIDTTLLKIIDKNSLNLLMEDNVSIYSYEGKLLYQSDAKTYQATSKEIIKEIIRNKEVQYTQGGKEVIGIFHKGADNDEYIVIASAYDKYGLNKLIFLKKTLIIGVFIAIGIIIILGLFFSKQALNPISNIIDQAEGITGSNLTARIHEGKGKDEIAHLAHSFNNTLDRIQNAFELQKSFVANSSHELRTPLTSITGQLEVVLMNPREPAEYLRVINSVLDDVKSINRLANGLLELAHTDTNLSRLGMKKIRIDELLLQSRIDLRAIKSHYKVNIDIIDINDDQKLIVFGDEYLLASAIFNVMENACKFSNDNQVNITLKSADNIVSISFINKGPGITENDLKKIGQPFYRGANSKGIEGHGIGLSLANKIVSQHLGQIHINSTLNESTEITIYLPTLRNILDNVFD